MSTLQTVWFALIAILLVGYTALAGFDLGIGFWHLAARKGEERASLYSIIGPVWDGNQVFLVTAGGALFAAFPAVYATVFSGFYLAILLLLFMLVLRTVAIEFGARVQSRRWDAAFSLTSVVAMLLLGVAFGNVLRGLPLNARGDFTGTFFTLLNPFALLVGVLNLALLATHGALYTAMKASGTLAARAVIWGQHAWSVAFLLLLAVFVTAMAAQRHLLANFLAAPLLWLLPLLTLGAFLVVPIANGHGKPGLAFAASSAGIILLLVTAAAALYPVMIPAFNQPEYALTAHNASSSYLTLKAMLVIALIGLPITYAYTFWAYRVFRGKARPSEHY